MSSLFWIIFLIVVAGVLLAMVGVVYSLRNFSRSNQQTIVDDKLWQSMIGDETLSPELKKAIVEHSKKSGDQTSVADGAGEESDPQEELQKEEPRQEKGEQ